MKTWRLKLVTAAGGSLTLKHALFRYIAGLAGSVCLGIGFLWAFIDRDGLFLHDRLAGTRVVSTVVPPAISALDTTSSRPPT